MPFIVRCPHCRKFMLIEDDRRGATGECLLCKQSVLFDSSQAERPAQGATGLQKAAAGSSPAGATATAEPKPRETPAPLPGDTETRTCPTCATKLRVPVAARGKKIRCPKCQQDFR